MYTLDNKMSEEEASKFLVDLTQFSNTCLALEHLWKAGAWRNLNTTSMLTVKMFQEFFRVIQEADEAAARRLASKGNPNN
jgi:hypothetical protein